MLMYNALWITQNHGTVGVGRDPEIIESNPQITVPGAVQEPLRCGIEKHG